MKSSPQLRWWTYSSPSQFLRASSDFSPFWSIPSPCLFSMLWTVLYSSLCAHPLSFILDKHQGLEWLCPMICVSLRYFREYQTALWSDYMIFIPYSQCMNGTVAQYTCWHLLWLIFSMVALLIGVQWYVSCHSKLHGCN